MVQVGDALTDATITRENNVVVVKMGSTQARFSALDSKGNTAPLDNAGNIGLRPGSRVRLAADGFKVGSVVEAWLFSTPTKLGETVADDKGVVDATFIIPKNAPVGSHRIVIGAVLMNGKKSTFTLGISITEIKKGKNVAPWIIGIPIFLAVVSGLFLPPALRQRRRKTSTL